MNMDRENRKYLLGMIAFAILLYVGLQNFESVTGWLGWTLGLISPFILGACIAFIINVPMRGIEKKLFSSEKVQKNKKLSRLSRPLSLVITLVLLIALIVVVMFIIVPELAVTIQSLAKHVPSFVNEIQTFLLDTSRKFPQIEEEIKNLNMDWVSISKKALNFLQQGAGTLLNSTFGVASSVINGVVKFFLGFVFAVYILLQKEKLGKQGKQLLYCVFKMNIADKIVEVLRMANRIFSNFLSGQCLEAVILGSMFFVTLTILRFPYALLVGVLIAFTALIPMFGAFIGCVISAFLILVNNPVQAFWFIIIFLVLQQLEGNFIYPNVVGSSVGLPSIWVLVAVTLGGSLMGVVGMLVFIPLSSVIYALIRESVHERLKEKKVPPEKWIDQ